jgi:hypothetical protein
MKAYSDLLQTLQELETELFVPRARKSNRVAQLLAEGFVEYGSSGRVYSRDEVISSLVSESCCAVEHK